jgi:uncharacterized membrane protein
VIAAVICSVMVLSSYGIIHWARRVSASGPAATHERQFRKLVQWLLLSAEYLVALATVALVAQAAGLRGNAVGLWIGLPVLLMLVLVMALIRGGQGGSQASASSATVPTSVWMSPVGDHTPDSCWKWGMFYVNGDDPALFVEKRCGIGYTLNFGHKVSWLILAVPLALAALTVIVSR